jgi:phosphatidate phosphatase APP1
LEFGKMALTTIALLFVLQPIIASPAALPNPVLDAEAALVTAPPAYPPPTRTIDRRNLFSDAASYANSLLDGAPSFITDGVANFFQGYPTGSAVLESAGVSSTDLDALPTQALNIPGYGNWTNSGWNLRVHGNIFKQPNISEEKINDLANVFLIDTSVKQLQPSEAEQARNLTRSIYVVQQGEVNVTVDIEPAPSAGSSGEQGGGGAVTPAGGSQRVTLPDPTTDQGDFDVFVPLSDQGLADGNTTGPPQRINVYVNGTEAGNATSYLVATDGLTIISDIDDILRVTKIYKPKEGLLNSFARPFTQWMNMPDIYANWSRSLPDTHFHYLTTTPEQVTRIYMDFIYKTYPGGSFDTRPLNFSDISATLSIRRFLLDKIFLTYPQRKFVLVADTSNSDVMVSQHPLSHLESHILLLT